MSDVRFFWTLLAIVFVTVVCLIAVAEKGYDNTLNLNKRYELQGDTFFLKHLDQSEHEGQRSVTATFIQLPEDETQAFNEVKN